VDGKSFLHYKPSTKLMLPNLLVVVVLRTFTLTCTIEETWYNWFFSIIYRNDIISYLINPNFNVIRFMWYWKRFWMCSETTFIHVILQPWKDKYILEVIQFEVFNCIISCLVMMPLRTFFNFFHSLFSIFHCFLSYIMIYLHICCLLLVTKFIFSAW
jgi:hypothetical protein